MPNTSTLPRGGRMRSAVLVGVWLGWMATATAQQAQPAPPSLELPPQVTTPSSANSGPQRTPAMLEGKVDDGRYVVGPGDRLRVEVWGLHELVQEMEVTADGRLVVPRAGLFDAAGATLATLRAKVEQRLHALYPKLESSLTLASPRSFVVHVTGQVAKPGSYTANALERVSALLPDAGGALPAGSLRRVEIRRRGVAEPIVADLVRFAILGQLDADPPLLDGDTIYVPPRKLTVEVSGSVRRPGNYELIDGTLAELFQLAGGLAADAARTRPLRIASREGGDRVAVTSAERAGASGIKLNDGDRVHVPALSELQAMVIIEGAVRGLGAIATAEAPLPQPEPRAQTVDIRPDSQTRPQSLSVAWVNGLGVRDVLGLAGGLQPWADAQHAYVARGGDAEDKRIPLDLVSITTGSHHDVPLEPGDRVVVPARRAEILISGAVQRPGYYPYSSDLAPRDYISLAGGPTRWGDVGAARVLSAGATRPIKKVKSIGPGDVITVPEHIFNAADWTTMSLVLGNITIGAVGIGLAATR
jgi:protein involved in polysaccharide export with SLBB domain